MCFLPFKLSRLSECDKGVLKLCYGTTYPPDLLYAMQKRKKKREKKEEEASLTLLPSNMMTTSFWAYSCISVSQAFKKYKRHIDTEELGKKKTNTAV